MTTRARAPRAVCRPRPCALRGARTTGGPRRRRDLAVRRDRGNGGDRRLRPARERVRVDDASRQQVDVRHAAVAGADRPGIATVGIGDQRIRPSGVDTAAPGEPDRGGDAAQRVEHVHGRSASDRDRRRQDVAAAGRIDVRDLRADRRDRMIAGAAELVAPELPVSTQVEAPAGKRFERPAVPEEIDGRLPARRDDRDAGRPPLGACEDSASPVLRGADEHEGLMLLEHRIARARARGQVEPRQELTVLMHERRAGDSATGKPPPRLARAQVEHTDRAGGAASDGEHRSVCQRELAGTARERRKRGACAEPR